MKASEYNEMLNDILSLPPDILDRYRKRRLTTDEKLEILNPPKEVADAWEKINGFLFEYIHDRESLGQGVYDAMRTVQKYVYRILAENTDYLSSAIVPEDD